MLVPRRIYFRLIPDNPQSQKILQIWHWLRYVFCNPNNESGQITIIPKPELRGFWGDFLTKPPFGVTSAEVAIICPDEWYCYSPENPEMDPKKWIGLAKKLRNSTLKSFGPSDSAVGMQCIIPNHFGWNGVFSSIENSTGKGGNQWLDITSKKIAGEYIYKIN